MFDAMNVVVVAVKWLMKAYFKKLLITVLLRLIGIIKQFCQEFLWCSPIKHSFEEVE